MNDHPNYRRFWSFTVAVLVFPLTVLNPSHAQAQQEGAKKPNILVIFGDDMEPASGIEPPTCGLRKPGQQDSTTPQTPAPTKGKRRGARELAHGYLALSCIGCEGPVLRWGTLWGTPPGATLGTMCPRHSSAGTGW